MCEGVWCAVLFCVSCAVCVCPVGRRRRFASWANAHDLSVLTGPAAGPLHSKWETYASVGVPGECLEPRLARPPGRSGLCPFYVGSLVCPAACRPCLSPSGASTAGARCPLAALPQGAAALLPGRTLETDPSNETSRELCLAFSPPPVNAGLGTRTILPGFSNRDDGRSLPCRRT